MKIDKLHIIFLQIPIHITFHILPKVQLKNETKNDLY